MFDKSSKIDTSGLQGYLLVKKYADLKYFNCKIKIQSEDKCQYLKESLKIAKVIITINFLKPIYYFFFTKFFNYY